ncbi:hypothetical protein IAI10_00695 [Clostridium sp. 19966]|uniref:hypothetical protein n=1 Tax=Clostridium sp. 19966 TaxID=2768166 RepID=UPI0028E00E0C|nr:hypothetical protein [Clostridium sp. 19966]MDT8715199.1 hypothetical protein [Clostridium sp. 19966]
MNNNDSKNNTKKRYLARTVILDMFELDKNDETITLSILCDVAWSLYSCWFDGYPQESAREYPTIKEVLKEMDIIFFEAKSIELYRGFQELVRFEKGDADIFYKYGDIILAML